MYKSAVVIQKGSESMMVGVSEMEKPEINWKSEETAKSTAKIWDESFKWYPVTNEKEFEYLAVDQPIGHSYKYTSFGYALSEGISIPPDRVEIVDICIQTGVRCGMTCYNEETCNNNKYAILKPIQTYSRSK